MRTIPMNRFTAINPAIATDADGISSVSIKMLRRFISPIPTIKRVKIQ